MKLQIIILSFLLLLMTNCSRYLNWVQYTFENDGCKKVIPIPRCDYVCSKTIYDQFRTVGMIDVLWLNAIVRKAYVELRKERQLLSCYDADKVAKYQLEKLNSEVAFYILIGPYNETSLSTDCQDPALWAVSLQVDDKSYQPYCIKAVDLEPEYSYFFNCFSLDDKNYFRFRQPYFVKFKAQDCEKMDIITPNARNVTLTISTVAYYTSCSWQISADKREVIW